MLHRHNKWRVHGSSLSKFDSKWFQKYSLSLILMVEIDRCKSIMGMAFQGQGNQWKNQYLLKLLAYKRYLSLWPDDDHVLDVLNEMGCKMLKLLFGYLSNVTVKMISWQICSSNKYISCEQSNLRYNIIFTDRFRNGLNEQHMSSDVPISPA